MNPYLYLILGIFIGTFVGIVIMSLMIRSRPDDPDTERMNAIVLFGWHISHNNGRWGVLKPVNGVLTLIGQTHSSLRGAVDAALEDMHGRG